MVKGAVQGSDEIVLKYWQSNWYEYDNPAETSVKKKWGERTGNWNQANYPRLWQNWDPRKNPELLENVKDSENIWENALNMFLIINPHLTPAVGHYFDVARSLTFELQEG